MAAKVTNVIVILGPTASGKTGLSIDIAEHLKKPDGSIGAEVISADSRQIYKGLDIGTGKVTKEEARGIPHHLIDILEPSETYSVARFVADATKAIHEIAAKGRTPIICGGTGFYIEALVQGWELPETSRNDEFEKSCQGKSTESLYIELQTKDVARAESIDPTNRRRVIRALEIATSEGSVPQLVSNPPKDMNFLKIAIDTADTESYRKKINDRLKKRLDQGMIAEAQRLFQLYQDSKGKRGISYERMAELGLEYKWMAEYLTGKVKYDEFVTILGNKIWQYARRQKTWFRRDAGIKSFKLEQKKEILAEVDAFLK